MKFFDRLNAIDNQQQGLASTKLYLPPNLIISFRNLISGIAIFGAV
jgi:hypothetical protein